MAPASTPDVFPSSEAFNTLIRINVGQAPNQRTFEVCKGVLCFYSGYFDTMLSSQYREARDHVVHLSTEDPKIFDMFQHWIHTRCLFESTLDPIALLDFQLLSELWVFGDAHDVSMFQNFVIDLILRKIKETETVPDAKTMQYIYSNTVSTARLRCLMQEFLCNVTGLSWNFDDLEDLPLSTYQSIGKDDVKERTRQTYDNMQPLPPPPTCVRKNLTSDPFAASAMGRSSIVYWAAKEHNDFIKCIRHFGRDFGAIAAHMGTKTAADVYEHYQRQVSGPKGPGIKKAADEADKRRASSRTPCHWHVHQDGKTCFKEDAVLAGPGEKDSLEEDELSWEFQNLLSSVRRALGHGQSISEQSWASSGITP